MHRWPRDFARVPDDEWTRGPVESLALKYDTVEAHGWYSNLEPTIDELAAILRDGDLVIDYSGGTGILADRLLHRLGSRDIGIVIVDASPKFLRRALEKLRADERVAFRLIRYIKAEKRLETIDEVVPASLLSGGVHAIVSTNAIHLYYDLPGTLRSWYRVLKPGGRAFVQSGNMRNPEAPEGSWIIDETVESIHRAAVEIVRSEPSRSAYRAVLDDDARMAAHGRLRAKYFLPVRPLRHYLESLEEAGLRIERVRHQLIEARVDEWYQFLAVYHEGVLSWVGGSERVEGTPPSEEAVRDRLEIMREAMERIFAGRAAFDACWSYITSVKP